MNYARIVFASGILAALVGCFSVAAMAYDAVSNGSVSAAASQSQQDKLDALVEQL